MPPSLNSDELKNMSVSVYGVCQEMTSTGEALIIAQKTHITFDSIDFDSYHSQRFIMKRMICHCGLSYKFIMPLCHHPSETTIKTF